MMCMQKAKHFQDANDIMLIYTPYICEGYPYAIPSEDLQLLNCESTSSLTPSVRQLLDLSLRAFIPQGRRATTNRCQTFSHLQL